MKKIIGGLFLISLLFVSSCEYFETVEPDDVDELSTEEIIEGLKKALTVGADSSISALSILDGYYKGHEQFVKIPLPEEAQVVREIITNNNLAELFNLDTQFENVIKSVNRAAETAAKEASPIFSSVISSMSIDQGWDILNGIVPGADPSLKSGLFDSTAATAFFKLKTYDNLVDLYAPKINDALGKNLGLGFSATDAWTTLTNSYNNAMSKPAVQAAIWAIEFAGKDLNLPARIDTDLGIFSTQKALNGLFYKVGQQERKIRRNPFEWAVDIIQRVFGYIQDWYEDNLQ